MLIKDARYARTMRRKGISFDEIVKFFDGKFTVDQIVDGMCELRRTERQYYHATYAIPPRGRKPTNYEPPSVVVEDREQRKNLVPRSLTALICGDPLPGCSALDRREFKPRSIIRDPLDDLLFSD